MISMWVLIGIAAMASGSPQSGGIALSFPDEYGADLEYGGLEDFYDNPDAKIWLPDNLDDSYGDPDYDGNPDPDYSNGLEPDTFVTGDDYLELPEWMDIDFNEIPLDKLHLLNNISDLTDLAAFFDLDQENAAKLSMLQTNDTHAESRSAGHVAQDYVNPVFARCEPERVKVVLEATENSNYLPSCVRLMRCGGCCNNRLLSCQPTKSEIVTLQVMKLSRTRRSTRGHSRGKRSSRRGRSRGRRTAGSMEKVDQENHLECSCQCKVQERHCNPALHNYSQAACACFCKDESKKEACQRNSRYQRWDNDTCSCMCHTIKTCGNGEFFSQNSCQCEQVPRE